MKYLPCVFLILLSNLANGQLISSEFPQVNLFDDFTVSSSRWDTKENTRERFVIENDRYIMHRSSETFFSVSVPEPFENYTSFEIAVKLQLLNDKDNDEESAGIIFLAQETGTGALGLEINSEEQYRLLILRNGSMRPLFPDNDNGWIYSRELKKNRPNLILLRGEAGSFDLYINGTYQQSFEDETYDAGGIGFYIAPKSTLYVDYIKVSTNSAPAKSDPTKVDPSEINDDTYSELIMIFRKKIDDQQNQINELERELSLCKTNLNIDTTARKQNVKLTSENRELRTRVQQLESALTKATTKLEYLESMKEDIEKGDNGDLIIGLTDLLSKEKKKNAALQEEIGKLEDEIEELKSGN